MNQIYIGIRSVTYAQKGMKLLQREGISAQLTRLPASLSPGGCAYALRLSEQQLHNALPLLKKGGVDTGKVFVRSGDSWQELRR